MSSPIKATEGGKGPYTREEIREATVAAQKDEGPGRHFSLAAIIGLAYAVLNSWTAMAASLSVALPSGGPVAVIWGIVPAFIGNLAMATSMAEICHSYPTSGGQYHWAAILAPPGKGALVSWVAGWFSVAGWWALTATASSLAGGLVTGLYALAHPGYEAERWHVFIVYVGYALLAMALNVWAPRLLPGLNQAAIIWSLAGACTIAIVILAVSGSTHGFQSGSFVFTSYINETGWNGGVAWILGLLQASFGLTGFDAVSHMVEEMPRPHMNAPRAMIAAVVIGAVSSFIFLVCLLFCITDVDVVNTSPAGALLAAINQGVNFSTTGSICLGVFPVVSMLFAAQGILTGSSRMTYAFARDGGLPFSKFLAVINPRTGVPERAVYLTSSLVIIFGCIYLGSSSALNAILSSSVVMLNISYSIPVALLLFRGRHLLSPPDFPAPTHSLGPAFGPLTNVVGLLFTCLCTVFFLFPPELPTTAESMNYAVAVIALIFIVSVTQWFVDGRKHFQGPRDLGGLLELARSEMAADERARGAVVQDAAEKRV